MRVPCLIQRPQVAVLDDWLHVAERATDWSPLRQLTDITFYHSSLGEEAVAARLLAPYQIVVPMRDRQGFPRSLLCRLPNLQMLALTGFSTRHVDLDYCKSRNIVCCGSGSYSPSATAELTLAIMLAATRGLIDANAALRSGSFQVGLRVGTTLEGKVLGIVGLGRIGTRVASYGQVLGMRVLAVGRTLSSERACALGIERCDKSTLLELSDVVSLHLPLSSDTREYLGAKELHSMKPGALLVNTARGGLLNESALLHALHAGRIRAALDTFDEEPLPATSPLLTAPNVLLTPHLGFSTEETFGAFYSQCVENILAYLGGTPIRRVALPD